MTISNHHLMTTIKGKEWQGLGTLAKGKSGTIQIPTKYRIRNNGYKY